MGKSEVDEFVAEVVHSETLEASFGRQSIRPYFCFSESSMENIRLRISIRLNQNHVLSDTELTKLKPKIARGIAGCLPDSISRRYD